MLKLVGENLLRNGLLAQPHSTHQKTNKQTQTNLSTKYLVIAKGETVTLQWRILTYATLTT